MRSNESPKISSAFFNPGARDPNIKQIHETLQLYHDIYIIPNLERLMEVESLEDIVKRLQEAKTLSAAEFQVYLENVFPGEDHAPIKAIYSMFHAIITGNLTRKDVLMDNLIKIAPACSMSTLNQIVSQKIPMLITAYLNQLQQENTPSPRDYPDDPNPDCKL